MTSDVDTLEQALQTVEQIVAAVDANRWTARTPCTDWDVRALVNHLVLGNQMFAQILTGTQQPPGLVSPGKGPADALGNAVVDDYRRSAVAVVAAFHAPGVMSRTFTVPFGSVAGEVALHLRTTEILVHGWDLARATGREVQFPDHVVARELAFSRPLLDQIPPDRHPFAPSQPASATAPLLDQLAACLGRHLEP